MPPTNFKGYPLAQRKPTLQWKKVNISGVFVLTTGFFYTVMSMHWSYSALASEEKECFSMLAPVFFTTTKHFSLESYLLGMARSTQSLSPSF